MTQTDIRKSLVGSMCPLHNTDSSNPCHKRSIEGGLLKGNAVPAGNQPSPPKSLFQRTASQRSKAPAPAGGPLSDRHATSSTDSFNSQSDSFNRRKDSPSYARFGPKGRANSDDSIGAGSSESFKKRLTEAEGDAFARERSHRSKATSSIQTAKDASVHGEQEGASAPDVGLSWCENLVLSACEFMSDAMEYTLPPHARGPVNRYGIDRIVIHPENRVKRAFDALVALSVVYVSISVPIHVTFLIRPAPTLDALVDALFLFDVFVQLISGYMDRGFPVLELRYAMMRYARSWMVMDIVASIPYERVYLAAIGEGMLDFTASRWLAILSCLKIIRFVRLSRLLHSFELLSSKSFRVFLSLGSWVLLGHWYGCIWFSIGWYSNACAGGPYPRTWVSDMWPQLYTSNCTLMTPGYQSGPPTISPADESIVPFIEKYILSFYWALSTMSSLGYGQGPLATIVPEFSLAVVAQLTGACVYAMIFGNIAQLIQKIDASGARYQQQLDKINEFARFHRLPNELSKKLREYNNFMFNVSRGFNVEEIASALPLHLQQEVFLHLHEHLVRQVPMFASCDDGFIKSLVQTLKPQVLLRGDCAFKAYETASTMYFIQNGCVQIVNHAMNVVHITLFSGAYFGELAMLTKQKRTGTALAATDCILFYITADDFEEVIKDYPTYYYTILDKAMERLERVLQSNSKNSATDEVDKASAIAASGYRELQQEVEVAASEGRMGRRTSNIDPQQLDIAMAAADDLHELSMCRVSEEGSGEATASGGSRFMSKKQSGEFMPPACSQQPSRSSMRFSRATPEETPQMEMARTNMIAAAQSSANAKEKANPRKFSIMAARKGSGCGIGLGLGLGLGGARRGTGPGVDLLEGSGGGGGSLFGGSRSVVKDPIQMRRGSDGMVQPLRVQTGSNGIVQPLDVDRRAVDAGRGVGLERLMQRKGSEAAPTLSELRRCSTEPRRNSHFREANGEALRRNSEAARRCSRSAFGGPVGRRLSERRLSERRESRRCSDLHKVQGFTGCLGVSGDDVQLGKESIDNYLTVLNGDVRGRAPIKYADLARDQVRQRYGTAVIDQTRPIMTASDDFRNIGVLGGGALGGGASEIMDELHPDAGNGGGGRRRPSTPAGVMSSDTDRRLAAIESALVAIASGGMPLRPRVADGTDGPTAECSTSSSSNASATGTGNISSGGPLDSLRQAIGMQPASLSA